MLLHTIPQLQSLAITMIDLGASGTLDPKWRRLVPLLDYIGFEPNADECARLNQQPGAFRSRQYLPYAIGDHEMTATLHTTRSIYCYSMLRPRTEWLNRFRFAALFEQTGTLEVPCTTLNSLHRSAQLTADIIKLDTQGVELQILQAADELVSQGTFCIEAETGFVENYRGETVYAQIDAYLRSLGFLMFDIKIYRMGRANQFQFTGVQQPLWCESIWLRDFLAKDSFGISLPAPTREQALKALVICEALGFMDYALELVDYFGRLGLLSAGEVASLQQGSAWGYRNDVEGMLTALLRLLPGRIRRIVLDAVGKAVDKPHLLRAVLSNAQQLRQHSLG